MDLHHRLMRQTIHIAVSKAMEDMRTDTKRGIRNLVDLGLLFSRSENQKWFFNTAKKVISNSHNPYNKLAARMVSDVDNETIKTVGINLGYTSLTYGANKLKRQQASINCPVPWLLIFDISEPCPDFFNQMEDFIHQGRELGIYSYIFRTMERKDIAALCKIAERFGECVFVLDTAPTSITEQSTASMNGVHNIVVSVRAEDSDINSENCINAFRILKQSRCFFGFQVSYNEDNINEITAPGYIQSAILRGNQFGFYIADANVPDKFKDYLYNFVCSERGEEGQPLITLDLFHDICHISEEILSNGGYMVINSAEKICLEYKNLKGMFENSLLEIIKSRMLCTNN